MRKYSGEIGSRVPVPIQKNILYIVVLSFGMLLIGSVVAHYCRDDTLLILSCVVLALGSLKAEDLWQKGIRGEYELIEGTPDHIRQINLQRKYKVHLTLEDGSERVLLLAGKPRLKEGGHYRFYLSVPMEGLQDWPFSDTLKPAQSIYGMEEIHTDVEIP